MKTSKFIEILSGLSSLLQSTNSSKEYKASIALLQDALEPFANEEFTRVVNRLNEHHELNSCEKRPVLTTKRSKVSNDRITQLLKMKKEGQTLLSDDASEIDNYLIEHTNLRKILDCPIEQLYENTTDIGDKNLTVDEIRLALDVLFNIQVGKRQKKDLYETLINRIYQHNYLRSLNKNPKIDT